MHESVAVDLASTNWAVGGGWLCTSVCVCGLVSLDENASVNSVHVRLKIYYLAIGLLGTFRFAHVPFC